MKTKGAGYLWRPENINGSNRTSRIGINALILMHAIGGP